MKTLVGITILAASFLLRGLLIQFSLNWFVCEPFSLPLVGFMQGLGIGLIVSYLAGSLKREYDEMENNIKLDFEERTKKDIIMGVISPTIGLGVAWIFHILM